MVKYAAKLQRIIYLATEMRKMELGLKGIEWVEKRLLEIELMVGKKKGRCQDRGGRGRGTIAVVVAPAREVDRCGVRSMSRSEN